MLMVVLNNFILLNFNAHTLTNKFHSILLQDRI